MKRLVEHTRFAGKAGIISWPAATDAGFAGPRDKYDRRDDYERPYVHLRWAFRPELGYPIAPFVVWARAAKPEPDTEVRATALGGNRYLLDDAYDDLVVTLDGNGSGELFGYGGMPLVSPLSARARYEVGDTEVRLSGPDLRVISNLGGSALLQVLAATTVADDPAWQEIEVVGLPGDGRPCAGTDLVGPQGMVGSQSSPEDAALSRFTRGAPYAGWLDQLPDGNAVPPWRLADPTPIVKLFQGELLDRFIRMVDSAGTASQQCQMMFTEPLPGHGQTAGATFNPLAIVMYGAVSDPLEALLLGFGTAYPASLALDDKEWGAVDGRSLDFMVTGTFLDDLGHKVERAALMLNPGYVSAPPTPAAITAVSPGLSAPAVIDGDYRAVVSVSWQAPSTSFGFAVGSHAFARNGVDPATSTELLMLPRHGDTAVQPLGASRNQSQPLLRSLSDTSWSIDSGVVPNQLRYSVAAQDVFGLWSHWAQAGIGVAEPPVSKVSVTAAQLLTSAAPGSCPADLTFDLTWNWSARSPRELTVMATRYVQTWPEDAPASLAPPSGDAFKTSGAGMLVTNDRRLAEHTRDLGVVRGRRLQGLAQVDAVRRAARRRVGRAPGAGARHEEGGRVREGPRLGS